MGMDNIIYKTVDNGRLHLAKDEYYIGSVNSYNNCITRFFANLFKKTIKVFIAGEEHCFNAKSYRNMLQRYGVEVNLENIGQFSKLEEFQILPQEHSLMRANLSISKVNKLTRRLINALHQNNVNLAKQYVGQGADINHFYWDRGNHGISFKDLKDGLPNTSLNMTATKYTPFMKARELGYQNLGDFMVDAKATPCEGEVVNFHRSVIHQRTEIEQQIRIARQPVLVRDRYNRVRRGGVVSYPTVDTYRREFTTFRDTVTKTHKISVDQYQFRKVVDLQASTYTDFTVRTA